MGEALVSLLDGKGIPTVVEPAGILPPRSSMNAVDAGQIGKNIRENPLYPRYAKAEDRKSAYEALMKERQEAEEKAEKLAKQEEKEKEKAERKKTTTKKTTSSRKKTSALDKAVTSAANTIGRELGKSLIRGLLGSLKR